MNKPENPPASEKTLRDSFAEAALQGLLASPNFETSPNFENGETVLTELGKATYQIADFMLKARGNE